MQLKISECINTSSSTQQANFANTPFESNATGKHSIIQNLPKPNIRTTSNHAYVTLTSVMGYFLAICIESDLGNNDNALSFIRSHFGQMNLKPMVQEKTSIQYG